MAGDEVKVVPINANVGSGRRSSENSRVEIVHVTEMCLVGHESIDMCLSIFLS